tara:strand:+ start:317 stop:2449 length:2133 start_codon:yes stop_codon:yes gene_type:complete
MIFYSFRKYFLSKSRPEVCNGIEKIFVDESQTIKVVFSTPLSSDDFSFSGFEALFDSSKNIIQSNRNTLKQVDIGNVKSVIKSFKIPNGIQGFIYRFFRKSKARRSYEYSFLLGSLSVNTPQPLGYIEVYQGFRLRQSYFISSCLEYDFLIRDVLDGKVNDRAALLKDFVAFTYHLHRNKILHLDYSAGNVCIKKVDEKNQFYLVDINRMNFGPVSTKSGVRNFSRITSDPEDIIYFANEYAKIIAAPVDVCQKNLLDEVASMRKHRDRKRKFKQLFKPIQASSYSWNGYSDQPNKLKDRNFKRKLYFLSISSSFKVCLAALFLPFFAFIFVFKKRSIMGKKIDAIGLSVNIDNPMSVKKPLSHDQLFSMVEELGVNNILVRIPLSDFNNIEAYFRLIERFSEKSVLVNILQDRDHINDSALAKMRLRKIFLRLKNNVIDFQIGNSVNRRKWGFISQNEYFDFFKLAQELKQEEFNDIKLLGGNIIDFELHYYIRSLFHGSPIRYDGVAAQLYVDRRGAPENKQFGFDTISKINFYSLIMRVSRKSANALYITEVNWPLKAMGKWAPAQGDCMVSESDQATYLVRYYLMMLATGRVEKCYWHQLVAPGYGLVNNLGDKIIKRDAYYCYQFLVKILDGGITRKFSERNKLFRLTVETDRSYVQALWTSADDIFLDVESGSSVFDMRGNPLLLNDDLSVCVSGSVIYLVDPK